MVLLVVKGELHMETNVKSKKAIIRRAGECKVVTEAWGGLTWYANAAQGNSDHMTVGKCIIKPGKQNPLHSHPNCDEVLVVQQGTIMHSIENGQEVKLGPGDVITLPAGLPHNARNISEVDAILAIAFSSAERETKGE
jgi:quercetin dioxygenase-like cupin family protein